MVEPRPGDSIRLKYVAELNPTKSEVRGVDPETEISFVPMEAVGEYGGLDLRETRPLEDLLEGYTYFRDGDVIVAKITPCFENGKGALASGLSSEIGIGTTELHVLRPHKHVDARYLFYVTASHRFRKVGESTMYGAGGQKRISDDFVADYRIDLPPLPTQRAIAAFLDRETAKIDGLIEKKRRLLGLLDEKRTALITRAVTRGLDPDVPMKDSGVEWLGEIPPHWDVARVKHVARLESGHTPDRKVPEYWNGGVAWLSLADTKQLKQEDVIEETEYEISAEGLANSSARVLPARTVAFSRDATIGLCAILDRPMAVSQHFIAWVCKPLIRPEYLLLVFRSMSQELDRLTMGATIRTLGLPEVGGLTTPLPPVEEQDRIISACREQLGHLDQLAGRLESAISLLQEYRTALISAAVTGQIDVPEAAA